MGRPKLIAVLVACLVAALGVAQTPQLSEAEKGIQDELRSIRNLTDEVRAVKTKELALRIRALPNSMTRFGFAQGLAFVSTEGDFGRDALQEVTTTLVVALKDAKPLLSDARSVDGAYLFLAQLAKYEEMRVDLDDAAFTAARARVEEIDLARASADFTLKDLSGKEWTLSELKGKVVLVNFWATWCPPCRKEMPDLQALYNEFKDDGLVVLALSDETLDKAQPFITEHKYTYPVLLDPERKVAEKFFVDGIPKNFIFDREGKLVAQAMDMRTMAQFRRLLAKAGLGSR